MSSKKSNKPIEPKEILICGSMSHYDIMIDYSHQLSEHKIPTLVPDNEHALVELPEKLFPKTKRSLSQKWLKEIRRQKTYGILVVNERKGELDNYIGANTFAEIVIAFNAKKRIFLLNDFYTPYEDELCAWNAVPLLGRLEELVSTYWKDAWGTQKEDSPQPQLFPV